MRIDVWTDIVCPFCYLGTRRFELALARFEGADDVEVIWHAFQLDPDIEAVATRPLAEKIAEKFGIPVAESERSQAGVAAQAEELGLHFDWRNAKYGNTFDAHRLVHLAAAHDLAGPMHARLMRAYFAEGVQIGDRAELARLAGEVGLPPEEVRGALAGDAYADAVREDQRAAREIGVSGVPFFVVDGAFAVSGAQPVEVFAEALRRGAGTTLAERA